MKKPRAFETKADRIAKDAAVEMESLDKWSTAKAGDKVITDTNVVEIVSTDGTNYELKPRATDGIEQKHVTMTREELLAQMTKPDSRIIKSTFKKDYGKEIKGMKQEQELIIKGDKEPIVDIMSVKPGDILEMDDGGQIKVKGWGDKTGDMGYKVLAPGEKGGGTFKTRTPDEWASYQDRVVKYIPKVVKEKTPRSKTVNWQAVNKWEPGVPEEALEPQEQVDAPPEKKVELEKPEPKKVAARPPKDREIGGKHKKNSKGGNGEGEEIKASKPVRMETQEEGRRADETLKAAVAAGKKGGSKMPDSVKELVKDWVKETPTKTLKVGQIVTLIDRTRLVVSKISKPKETSETKDAYVELKAIDSGETFRIPALEYGEFLKEGNIHSIQKRKELSQENKEAKERLEGKEGVPLNLEKGQKIWTPEGEEVEVVDVVKNPKTNDPALKGGYVVLGFQPKQKADGTWRNKVYTQEVVPFYKLENYSKNILREKPETEKKDREKLLITVVKDSPTPENPDYFIYQHVPIKKLAALNLGETDFAIGAYVKVKRKNSSVVEDNWRVVARGYNEKDLEGELEKYNQYRKDQRTKVAPEGDIDKAARLREELKTEGAKNLAQEARGEVTGVINELSEPNLSVEKMLDIVHKFNEKYSRIPAEGMYTTDHPKIHPDLDVTVKYFENGRTSISVGKIGLVSNVPKKKWWQFWK